jgi:type 1 glutamine amidotransferase
MFCRTSRLAFALAALAVVGLASDAPGAEKIKVLLMGGRGHDWRGFHDVISKVLEKTGDFELTLSENLDDLRRDNIGKFNVVMFYGSGGNFANAEQEQGLGGFVENGGGVVGVHATDAFKKSDVYWRLLGGRFTGHGGGQFMMRIEDKEHPVTKPMGDFEISDETYRNDYHPAFKLHNLARMDRGQEQQSMVWEQTVGKGRVLNTTLGHGKAAFDNPQLQRLIVRALYWAAGREPKDPK